MKGVKQARREKRAMKRWHARSERKRIPRRELARRLEAARTLCVKEMSGANSTTTFGLARALKNIVDGGR